MKLFVFHTPALTPPGLPDCGVAIDVLRATTTLAAFLAAGAEAVQAFAGIEETEEAAREWPPGQVLLAGERGGDQVPGFDWGNSPFIPPTLVQGKRVLMTTTNGTQTLARLREAPVLLTASLVNAERVISFLKFQDFSTVWLVCSGWEGAFSLEDTFCAGVIAEAFPECLANDEAIAAIALYRQWKHDPLALMHRASHGQRLLRRGLEEDLAFCATFDALSVLPTQKEPGLFRAE